MLAERLLGFTVSPFLGGTSVELSRVEVRRANFPKHTTLEATSAPLYHSLFMFPRRTNHCYSAPSKATHKHSLPNLTSEHRGKKKAEETKKESGGVKKNGKREFDERGKNEGREKREGEKRKEEKQLVRTKGNN